MSIIPPSKYDANANGSFIVQDKYSSYDVDGFPLDTRTAIGNSIFYGNVTVKGNTTFEKNVTLPNYYNTTYIDTSLNNYVTKSGSTMTGQLTVSGVISDGGTNQFNTNITLPTTYNSSPNTTLPDLTQLGGDKTRFFWKLYQW